MSMSEAFEAEGPHTGELVERARRAREIARTLRRASAEMQKRRIALFETLLRTEDLRLDMNMAHPARLDRNLARARRLAVSIGRDPTIEDAKIMIARSSGCSPSDAYAVLVEKSQRTNRKLRVVAAETVRDLRDQS